MFLDSIRRHENDRTAIEPAVSRRGYPAVLRCRGGDVDIPRRRVAATPRPGTETGTRRTADAANTDRNRRYRTAVDTSALVAGPDAEAHVASFGARRGALAVLGPTPANAAALDRLLAAWPAARRRGCAGLRGAPLVVAGAEEWAAVVERHCAAEGKTAAVAEEPDSDDGQPSLENLADLRRAQPTPQPTAGACSVVHAPLPKTADGAAPLSAELEELGRLAAAARAIIAPATGGGSTTACFLGLEHGLPVLYSRADIFAEDSAAATMDIPWRPARASGTRAAKRDVRRSRGAGRRDDRKDGQRRDAPGLVRRGLRRRARGRGLFGKEVARPRARGARARAAPRGGVGLGGGRPARGAARRRWRRRRMRRSRARDAARRGARRVAPRRGPAGDSGGRRRLVLAT